MRRENRKREKPEEVSVAAEKSYTKQKTAEIMAKNKKKWKEMC